MAPPSSAAAALCAASFLALLPLGGAIRQDVNNYVDSILEANASSSYPAPGSCPLIQDMKDMNSCNGQGMWGSLVLSCLSAKNLYNSDHYHLWGRLSDPFCRISLVDADDLVTRGSSWVFNYKKYRVIGDRKFETKTIMNNLNPVWDETLRIDIACPEWTKNKKLEITIKDSDIGTSEGLGHVYLNLADVFNMDLTKHARHQQFPLTRNLADTKDQRKSNGYVNMGMALCPFGDDSCVEKAATSLKAPVKANWTWDCYMSCTGAVEKKLHAAVQVAVEKISKIQVHALPTSQDGAVPGIAQVQWNEVKHMVSRREIPTTLHRLAWECGDKLAEAMKTEGKLELGELQEKPTQGQVHGLLKAFKDLESRLGKLMTCLNKAWWAGYPLPNKVNVSETCFHTLSSF